MKLKKVFSLFLCSSLLFSPYMSSVHTVSAAEVNEASQMSETEFDSFLVDYLYQGSQEGKSDSELNQGLQNYGVELVSLDSYDVNSETAETTDNAIAKKAIKKAAATYTHPSEVTVSIAITKVSGSSLYQIYTYVHFTKKESKPGALDLLSVEWDSSVATYNSKGCDEQITTCMDISKRARGIVLFNVEDDKMTPGAVCYAKINVKPKKSARLKASYKYVHTYNDQTVSWAIGGNVDYEEGGLSGGLTYSLSGTDLPSSWQRNDYKSCQVTA